VLDRARRSTEDPVGTGPEVASKHHLVPRAELPQFLEMVEKGHGVEKTDLVSHGRRQPPHATSAKGDATRRHQFVNGHVLPAHNSSIHPFGTTNGTGRYGHISKSTALSGDARLPGRP
jgi:hypothetical protein